MKPLNFDYHYGLEANQYSFYRIPKALFTDKIFKSLSCEAKVLYGLMLDRMGLSIKNNWVDENNRVYIFFTLDDAKDAMCCGQEKGVKLFAELDDVKGIGLIERRKQGMGRPARIYVKSFVLNAENRPLSDKKTPNDSEIRKQEVNTSENQNSSLPKNRLQDIGKSNVKASEKPTSSHPKIGSNDIGKPNRNNTDISDTDFNDTDTRCEDQSIYPSIHQSIGSVPPKRNSQPKDAYEVYRQIIKDNIDYGSIFQSSRQREDVDEIVELILEAVCTTKKYLRVNSENIPSEIVKSRLLKLDFTHVEYVLDSFKTNTTKVSNIRNYLLTALYNSYTSISHYYKSEVMHDMYGSS